MSTGNILGLIWENIGSNMPLDKQEFTNQDLSVALNNKTTNKNSPIIKFTNYEWDTLNISNLTLTNYVSFGNLYYIPINIVKTVILNSSVSPNILVLTYVDDTIENITLNDVGYTLIYNRWYNEIPMFISDKNKDIIRSMKFVKIGHRDIVIHRNNLNNYFKNSNNHLTFFYHAIIRNVQIPYDKINWNNKN